MKKISSLLLALSLASAAASQEAAVYREPSSAITAVADAAPTPGLSLSPDGQNLLLLERRGLPPIADLAQAELRLAGIRINPRLNGLSRRSYSVGLRLQPLEGGEALPVTGLPQRPRLENFRWSPDARSVAFTHATESAIELWLLDVDTANAKRLSARAMNAVMGSPCSWMADSQALLCLGVDSQRGAAPVRASVSRGPVIQESTGSRAAARTFQDLLQDSDDEDLFEYYLTSEPLLVGVEGSVRSIGPPAPYVGAEPSPDGQLVLVESLHRPFSCLVPYYRFPRRVSVVDLQGSVVAELADLPLADTVPIGRGAVPTGPRNHGWRSDEPATLSWVEARDGGDPRREADVRDEVFLLPAPFDGNARLLAALGDRYAGVAWGDAGRALVFESWWRTRRARTWLVDPRSADSRLLVDRSTEDRYGDPGFPVLERNAAGQSVLAFSKDGRSVYLSGAGASPEGDRPFLDRFDLETLESERLWRSDGAHYESFFRFAGGDRETLLTMRESPTEVPNVFVRAGSAAPRQVTSFEHPYPQLAGVYKEVLRYQRDDGTDLQATLYLPPGKSPEDGPFPILLWAYPREFKDARSAGQMRGSPHRFKSISVRGPLPLLAAGFAVLDRPTMPIVGEGDAEPNDRYVEQLISSAQAAIDEVVERGVAERQLIAIGGHSYGAFMTANLLAHSDLFRTGIARSGAYNRTLTPFGFQAEERTFWEAPEVYFAMSPFMHADKVNEPVLMLHGVVDNNSGTFPLQSERFYNALKGHGARARLVMLPHESHGYASRESVLHTLYEMEAWLQRWLVDDSAVVTSGP